MDIGKSWSFVQYTGQLLISGVLNYIGIYIHPNLQQLSLYLAAPSTILCNAHTPYQTSIQVFAIDSFYKQNLIYLRRFAILQRINYTTLKISFGGFSNSKWDISNITIAICLTSCIQNFTPQQMAHNKEQFTLAAIKALQLQHLDLKDAHRCHLAVVEALKQAPKPRLWEEIARHTGKDAGVVKKYFQLVYSNTDGTPQNSVRASGAVQEGIQVQKVSLEPQAFEYPLVEKAAARRSQQVSLAELKMVKQLFAAYRHQSPAEMTKVVDSCLGFRRQIQEYQMLLQRIQ
ncbi:Hypothetical_protein [Hexamita inflata]|uniref:Hypothetical_protein n=1 Tax=Hexamita inflata TaxID=28002 RepID=A0AA86R1Q4_9EUKA|nr:Hypothetical protein HINF_LOCUS51878 [Hexamita inflata]